MFKNKLIILAAAILFAVSAGYLLWSFSFQAMRDNINKHLDFSQMDMSEKQNAFLALRGAIVHENMEHGDYACCLEKPCAYCIEKTPGHGEGTTCSCLDDVVNGRHPCGECIGEILEGHGNKFLKDYFAAAIAEKVGQEHLSALEKIIEQKYGVENSEAAQTNGVCSKPDGRAPSDCGS